MMNAISGVSIVTGEPDGENKHLDHPRHDGAAGFVDRERCVFLRA